DPQLAFSSFLGGGEGDYANAIAVDSAGNVYLAGRTSSTDFPTTTGAFRPAFGGAQDAFLAKVNPALSGTAALVYASFLGGSGGDQGTAIAVDSAGNVYLAGPTSSTDFPTTTGAFQPG